jgi:hypothetical protein
VLSVIRLDVAAPATLSISVKSYFWKQRYFDGSYKNKLHSIGGGGEGTGVKLPKEH